MHTHSAHRTVSTDRFGDPGVVTLRMTHAASPTPNQAVVRVEATAVNPLDLKILAGHMEEVFPVHMPYTPGTDFSGVVTSIGNAVTNVRPGDRVFGRTAPTAGGAFADHLVIDTHELHAVPRTMSSEQAAALPTVFGTAWQALFEVGNLRRGQRVLIHAGAGGVGATAVQLAHDAGAYVIATASASRVERVHELGADEVVDYRNEDFTRVSDVDLVLDTIGGDTLDRSWSVLGKTGRIVTLIQFDIRPRGTHDARFVFFADAAPYLAKAAQSFQEGRLQVLIDSIFPLTEARAALEKVATGHAGGKVVIRPDRG